MDDDDLLQLDESVMMMNNISISNLVTDGNKTNIYQYSKKAKYNMQRTLIRTCFSTI